VTARERAQLVLEDTHRDAVKLDSTPFTPRGIGTVLGEQLAMIAALASCIIELTEET
jgi:hypothetical protein